MHLLPWILIGHNHLFGAKATVAGRGQKELITVFSPPPHLLLYPALVLCTFDGIQKSGGGGRGGSVG